MTNEPVTLYGAVVAVAIAIAGTVEAFTEMTEAQDLAVSGLLVAIAGFGAFITRKKVTPVLEPVEPDAEGLPPE